MRMTLTGLEQDALYLVQLRTVGYGSSSAWSRMFELETIKDDIRPGPVSNISAVNTDGNLLIAWQPPTLNEDGSQLRDLKDYKVTISPVPSDPDWPIYVGYFEANKFEFTKEMNIASFGRYRTALSISVQARDIVDNLSDQVTIVSSKPAPNPPSNLTWVVDGNAFKANWTAPTQSTDGSQFTDPAGFEVKVIYTSNEYTDVILGTSFLFDEKTNKAAFGGATLNPRPKSPLTIEVRTLDSVGQKSEPATVTTGNDAPEPPSFGPDPVSAAEDGLLISWSASPSTDILYYEVWVSESQSDEGVLSGRTANSPYFHPSIAHNSPVFISVIAVDHFESKSTRITTGQAYSPKNPSGVDVDPPSPVNGYSAIGYNPDMADPAGILVTFLPAEGARGYHVTYAPASSTDERDWEYHDVFDPTPNAQGDITTIIRPLRRLTNYKIKVRSYDEFINTSSWSSEFGTYSSDSNNDFELTDISSDISIISGGTLRSANFREAVPGAPGQGWRLMPTGLDIENGKINARVVSAGELRSSLIMPAGFAGEGQPVWSLNTEGHFTARTAKILGWIAVGEPNNPDNNRIQISSANYGSATGSQWSIRADGSMFFRGDGTNGGSLRIGVSGIESYDTLGAKRVDITNRGTFAFSSSNGGLVFNETGLFIYRGSTQVISMTNTGNATFEGDIRATSGVIGGVTTGWNIQSNNISSQGLSLRSDLGAVIAGTGSNAVGMRAFYGIWAGGENPFTAPVPPFRVSVNGYLESRSGVIGGWNVDDTGLWAGPGGSRVQMMPGVGIWAGSTNYNTAPTRIGIDGQFFTSDATVEGDIRARLFRSYRSTAGLGNYIEIGVTGTNDPVDEVRFFLNSTVSSLRNPSAFPGALCITAENNPYYFTPSNGFKTNGNSIDLSSPFGGGPGQIINVSRIWNSGLSAYFTPKTNVSIEIGSSAQARLLSVSNVPAGGTKTFVVDNPRAADRYLVHATLEGPTSDVYYRGEGRLERDGGIMADGSERVARTEITLPHYFEDLTELEDRTVIITPVSEVCPIDGKFLAPAMSAGPVVDGKFMVYAMAGYKHDCARFFWEVKAKRKGETFEVEPSKAQYVRQGQGPYTYLTRRPNT